MKKEKVWEIYDEEYVSNYNDNFLLDPYSKAGADFEISIFNQLITKETKWLDIACGTGYFLSQFPGVDRIGFDLSPNMLAKAKSVNPDVSCFREGDFREDVPEWHGQFSLISCMWSAYSYVESVADVEKLVINMVYWLKKGGDLFIPIVDLEDLRKEVIIVPYEEVNPVYGGTIAVTSCTWTWTENNPEKVHTNMIAPHVEHFIRWLQPYFETIDVVRYPAYRKGWCTKKAIVARRRTVTPASPGQVAVINRHPIPPDGYQPKKDLVRQNYVTVFQTAELSTLSNKQIVKEFLRRTKNGKFFKAVLKKLM